MPPLRSPFIFSLISSAILIASDSHAKAEDPQQQPQHIETYTVTARHWQEPTLSVPASIDSFVPNERQADLEQLDKHVSNVRIEQSSVQTRVAIRGSSGYDTSLQQPVGYYLDDIALPLGGTQLPVLFNLEQIEVIKGPQGDLYGRNSEAGVIKLRSFAPSWQPSGHLHLSSGVTDGANDYQPSNVLIARGSNALIDDRLAGSIALRVEQTQGPQLNLFNGDEQGGQRDNWAAAIGFDVFAGESTDIKWRSHIARQESGKAQMRYLTGANATPRFTTNYNTPTFDNSDSDIHSLRIDHQLGAYTLSAITGVTLFERDFAADLDLTPAPLPATTMQMDDRTLSQEFRLTNDGQSALRWLAGLYFYQQETDVDFSIGGSMMMPRTQRITHIDQTGIAGFGQLAWQINDQWEMTLGARAERIDKEGQQRFNGLMSSQYQANLSHTTWLPKASISYLINPTDRLYGTIAQGYLPAGYNYASAQNLASFTYQAEKSTSTELGYKALLLENALTVTAAAFHITTKDKQITDLQPGFVQTISNAAQTTSYGVELSADYQWHTDFSSFVRLGTMKTKADKYITHAFNGSGFVAHDLAGNELPLAPEFTYAIGIEYQPQQGWFTTLVASGSSDYYFDSANSLSHPAYVTADATLGYRHQWLTIALNADNIFDQEVYSRSVRTPAGIVAEDTQERYFGLTIGMDW